jgi:hypothetical protein
MRRRTSLVTGIGLGLAAGAAGTAVMTALQGGTAFARGKGGASFKEPRTWAEAPAPAQLAKKALGPRIVKRQAPVVTAAIHWGYGTALGALYGAMQSRLRVHPLLHGAAFGTAVWGVSYAALTPLGIYEAPWRYPARELAVDWSYHAAYGLGVAGAFEALERR